MRKYKVVIVEIIAVLLLVLAILLVVMGMFKNSSASLDVDETIDNTPVSVERMRQIGQWEFLSVSDEELVDTVRKRIFGEDELIRIYYGEIRLGIDMAEMKDDAIVMSGDSVFVTLPEVKLLDNDFIDEARTKPFFESGSWSASEREMLYKKAKYQMLEKCFTDENRNAARHNAVVQVGKMLRALGIENVGVR